MPRTSVLALVILSSRPIAAQRLAASDPIAANVWRPTVSAKVRSALLGTFVHESRHVTGVHEVARRRHVHKILWHFLRS